MNRLEHRCNKEVEIAEMHKDIKYIIKLLDGNGKPGLKDQIQKNTKFRHQFEGRDMTKHSLLGNGWLVAILLLLAQILLRFI